MRIDHLGDAALVVTLGYSINARLNARVVELAQRLRSVVGVADVIASYGSATIHYDPEAISSERLRETVIQLAPPMSARAQASAGRLHEISVIYDGPDLEQAAGALELSIRDLVDAFQAPTYSVFLIGFLPGTPYLGPLPSSLRLPRRSNPRVRVPPGSVAIAGRQATVYTWPSPGGWHLLGRTTLQLFDADANPPNRLQAGDRVKFVSS